MYVEEFKDCLDYIDSYWDRIIHTPTRRKINKHIVEIPFSYVTPNDKLFDYIFYWDSFFIFRGLMGTKRDWVMKDMVDNFIFLQQKYGFIPNFNTPIGFGRSQPPFLSSMLIDTYNNYYKKHQKSSLGRFTWHLTSYRNWLWNCFETVKDEYQSVWIDKSNSFNHSVRECELARYGDQDIGNVSSSEIESGWDFTSRYYNRCNEFTPIDLNVYLYKYEQDFAQISRHLGDRNGEEHWKRRLEKRRVDINAKMWSEKKGFYFDFCYTWKRHSDFLSLAGFTPMWAGMATPEQARRMVRRLDDFETPYGLTITAKESLGPEVDLSEVSEWYRAALEDVLKPKQWDFPNIWAPLEYLTVVGLLKYGYVKDAKRIMDKSVRANAANFRKYGTFFEKWNGETGDKPASFGYESQEGFGWTNAMFYRYTQLLDAIDSGQSIYTESRRGNAPYSLAVIH
jgi:alpha,alpha-trehalase